MTSQVTFENEGFVVVGGEGGVLLSKFCRFISHQRFIEWLFTVFCFISEHCWCGFMVSVPQISKVSRAAQDNEEKLLRGPDDSCAFFSSFCEGVIYVFIPAFLLVWKTDKRPVIKQLFLHSLTSSLSRPVLTNKSSY